MEVWELCGDQKCYKSILYSFFSKISALNILSDNKTKLNTMLC